MKTKQVVMMCVMLFAGQQAFSQAQFALGIKAGPNFASIDTKDAVGTYKNRTGFHGGAFALIKFTKIGIQPEVLFSQQGSKVKFNTQNLESNYSYINIPILLKLYTVAGINVQAGPQFGFLTKAESDFDPITGAKYGSTQDVKDAYKKSDVSLALGLGWDLPFGLTIDGRYNLGLSKINNSSSAPEQKNQVWQLSLGYKIINLGK
jgi:hypothetical protein